MSLDYHHDILHLDGQSLNTSAEQFGTPLYIYSQSMMQEAARTIDSALEGATPHLICYAVKANPTLAVIKTFGELGFGADVTSGGELYRALKADIPADRIVFSGVGKTSLEIQMGISAGIKAFHVESPWEIDLIAQEAHQRQQTACIALRVNPNVDAHTHPSITTGKQENKFGIAWGDIPSLISTVQANPALCLVGLSMHLGSQITEINPYQEAARMLVNLARDLTLDYLDFGGGLGVTYDHETPPNRAIWGSMLREVISDLPLQIIVEPGRTLVAEAGLLLMRVLGIKQSATKTFVITDAGMTELIRPMLYDAYHPIWPVHHRDGEQRIVDIVGPICETTDTMARDRKFALPQAGDLLAVGMAGAYGASMASNYNSRCRPAEVMIMANGTVQLIRTRETYEDLIRVEAL